MSEDWNQSVATRVHDGLIATRKNFAASTSEIVRTQLDDYVRAWRRERTELCIDAHVRETVDAELALPSVACLDDRRAELQALVDGILHAPDELVESAAESSYRLAAPNSCRNPTIVRQLPEDDLRAPVRAIRRELSAAKLLGRAAKYADALAAFEVQLARAKQLGWAPLEVQAALDVGFMLHATGQYEPAKQMLMDVYFRAADLDPFVAADAARFVAFMFADALAEPQSADVWLRLAKLETDRLDVAQLSADWSYTAAVVAAAKGDTQAAREHGQRSLELREQALGPEHPLVAASLSGLAVTSRQTGDYEQALAWFERAHRIFAAAYGPDHPDVARSFTNLGNMHYDMSDFEEAVALHRRAVAIEEAAYGPDHPHVAGTLNNLANALCKSGAYSEAEALNLRALDIRERTFGPDSAAVAISLTNLGMVYNMMEQPRRAKVVYERALAILRPTPHPTLAATLTNLGSAHYALGEYRQARAVLEEAVTMFEATLGSDHPDLGHTLHVLGLTDLELRQPERGLAALERALSIRGKGLGESDALTQLTRDDLAAAKKRLHRPG